MSPQLSVRHNKVSEWAATEALRISEIKCITDMKLCVNVKENRMLLASSTK